MKTFPLLAIGFIVTLALAGPGPIASAHQTEPFTIALWVRDTAQVPEDVLTVARAAVTQIYLQAGVETVWRAPSSPSAEIPAGWEPRLTIAILSGNQAKRLHPALTRDRLGIAPGNPTTRGRLAYVFYERVERLTGGNGLDRAHVLGHAMAHEIGHLLLPHNAHSQTGLMQAKWAKADLWLAQRSQLFFTAEQGELIRRRMVASWQQ